MGELGTLFVGGDVSSGVLFPGGSFGEGLENLLRGHELPFIDVDSSLDPDGDFTFNGDASLESKSPRIGLSEVKRIREDSQYMRPG
jgi:hypothetical protein